MVKLIVDEPTGKIFGYENISKNSCLYKTDVMVEEAELVGVNPEKAYLVNGKVCEKEEEGDYAKIRKLDEEIEQNKKERGKGILDYLLERKTLTTAVKIVEAVKKTAEELEGKREELVTGCKKKKEEYYTERNREADKKLECKFYSALVLLIKDENRYLKEWLDWHLALGFGHIYIYDNGTVDHVQDVVDGCGEEKKRITVVDWTGHHEHIQQDAYNHFMENYRENVRWGLFIDSDEFLRFTDGETTNVNTFLKDYEDYTEVWGYEVEYGANGQETYEDKPVRERFTKQADAREGFYWKNFIQVNRIDRFIMHYAYYDPAKHGVFKNGQANKDLFVIDHYYTKSWEEWQRKIKERGGADPNYHKALREFFLYNPDMAYLDTGEDAVQAYEEGV